MNSVGPPEVVVAFTTATVSAGNGPRSVAVNPVTNKIYFTNTFIGASVGNVTVIDGTNNSTATVMVGSAPGAAVAGGPPVKKETDDRLSRHRREAMMA